MKGRVSKSLQAFGVVLTFAGMTVPPALAGHVLIQLNGSATAWVVDHAVTDQPPPVNVNRPLLESYEAEMLSAEAGGAYALASGYAAIVYPGIDLGVQAHGSAASDGQHAANSNSVASVGVSALVVPTVSGRPPGHQLTLHHRIAIHGSTSVSWAFDYADAHASIQIRLSGGLVASAGSTKGTESGSTDFPEYLDVSFPNWVEGFQQEMDLNVFANGTAAAFGIPGDASSYAANFGDTFTWEGITSAFDVTTGEPIPIEDVHLIDEDGLDWAHPETALLAVPPALPPSPVSLSQSFPNPSSGDVAIEFSLPREEHVTLQVFDLRGALVRTLIDGRDTAGPHTARWDGRVSDGTAARTGVYFYVLRAGDARLEKRLLLVR